MNKHVIDDTKRLLYKMLLAEPQEQVSPFDERLYRLLQQDPAIRVLGPCATAQVRDQS
jgi:hypothetical protein